MTKLTAKAFFADNRPFGKLASEQPIISMPSEDLFALMQAYADHCEESAWVDAKDHLPEENEDYPWLSVDVNVCTSSCVDIYPARYAFRINQWVYSSGVGQPENVTHWKPIPNAPQAPKEEEN